MVKDLATSSGNHQPPRDGCGYDERFHQMQFATLLARYGHRYLIALDVGLRPGGLVDHVTT